jgi:hypothetical protein
VTKITVIIYYSNNLRDNGQDHSIKNREELIQILRTTRPEGILASLDVESLFTNVPIEATIAIILQNTYNNDIIAPPRIPQKLLESLLRICTTEAPFRHIDGSLYYQTEGVAMGSPLGPTFANFYMANVEKQALQEISLKPNIYARYVDDIFVVVRDEEHIKQLQEKLQNNSVLRFTYELGNKTLPFLDVKIENMDDQYHTTVYVKNTNTGECLNYQSECPDKYKIGVINTFLRRAYSICNNWHDIHNEIKRIKQLLVNNGYPISVIDYTINNFISSKMYCENRTNKTDHTVHKLYYENQMHKQYKVDERALIEIFHNKVQPTTENSKVALQIYYKNSKVSNLIMRNSTASQGALQCSNVVYQIKCPVENCESPNPNYIGYTECTLAQRLTMHVQDGGPKEHALREHNVKINRDMLINNTSIIATFSDVYRLKTYEALMILQTGPTLNRQHESFTNILKLFHSRAQSEQVHLPPIPEPVTQQHQQALLPVRQYQYLQRRYDLRSRT